MSKSIIQPCPCCGGKARLKQAKYNVLGSYGDAELISIGMESIAHSAD